MSRIGAALVVLLWSFAAHAGEITLKVAHFLPPTSTAHAKFLVPWCDRLHRDSGGRLKCQIFPAMQLGGAAPQLYDQARDGVADIIWTVGGYTPGRFTKTEVFELPFMMTTPEATAHAMWDFAQTYAQDEFRGVKLLALHPHGPGVFHLNSHPIRTLADFRGLKLRAPTRLTNRMLAAFGAVPVGMPMTQVPESLSKGVIDGALMPWEVVPAVKVQELTKYHSETDPSERGVYTTVLMLVMNRARYESLPADLRKVIDDDSGVGLSEHAARVFRDADAPARALVPKDSINVVPAAELAKWKQAARSVEKSWIRDVGRRGADGEALLAAARRLIDQYTDTK